jgi:putative membrane protein
MANERTLLSWVRTGVTIVSIGLIVQRFGAEVGPAKVSGIFGVALVGLGCLTLIRNDSVFPYSKADRRG